MNQETLVSNLKERLGTDANISDRTLNEFVPTILSQFENDEQVTDDTYKPYVTLLKSLGGQIRHDVSDGITNFKNGDEFKGILAKNIADFKGGDEYKTLVEAAITAAKAEWEKSKNPPPAQKPGEDDKPDVSKLVAEAVAEAMKGLTGEEGAIGKLNKTVTDFTTSYKAQQTKAQQDELKSQVRQYLKDRKADRDAVINLAIDMLEIGESADINVLKAQAEANYEKRFKEFYGDGIKPFGGQSQGGGGNGDADLKARLEQMKKDAETSANQAEALRKTFV